MIPPKDKLLGLAERLPADVKRALLEPGAAIPDSLWFGRYRDLRESVPDNGWQWRWSKKGRAVAAALHSRSQKDEKE
jgi:hypothetical protein